MSTKLTAQALSVSLLNPEGFAGLRFSDGKLQIKQEDGWQSISTGTSLGQTVEFVDTDGTVLQSSVWAAGDTPVFSGALPTKSGYQFAGWTPEIQTVSPPTVTYETVWAEDTSPSVTVTACVQKANGTATISVTSWGIGDKKCTDVKNVTYTKSNGAAGTISSSYITVSMVDNTVKVALSAVPFGGHDFYLNFTTSNGTTVPVGPLDLVCK